MSNQGRTLIYDTQASTWHAHSCSCLLPLSADRKPAEIYLFQTHHRCLSLRCLSSCRCAGGPAGVLHSFIPPHFSVAHSLCCLFRSILTLVTDVTFAFLLMNQLDQSQDPILISHHGHHSNNLISHEFKYVKNNLLAVSNQQIWWFNYSILILATITKVTI